ncbi:MAG: restriction endonuclease [Ruminococcaceae bacterium]|nr:restriction endonuclease [Oscillospiraceae bacterium]
MTFDSRDYRRQLGFTNQENLKKHFKATDIICINWDKIEQCNQRLKDMFRQINRTVHPSVKWINMNEIDYEIDNAYTIMRENDILPHLNNYGRYPEDLYYNWMRGYIVCKYFAPALARIFNVPEEQIRTVGHDSLAEIETFSQSPVADLEIRIDNTIIRLEIQSGYTGVNDIKAHKVREAQRAFRYEQILSYVVHFDLFNGTMAIVDITNIDENSIHWVTRAQMEGQRVFSIPDEAFCWFLPDEPPYYLDILF